jgi:pullulanase
MDRFSDYPVYYGNDLGVNYTPVETVFKVWAPKASDVKLRLYDAGDGGNLLATQSMTIAAGGIWTVSVKEDLKNVYYTFHVQQEGAWLLERPDIYAYALGVNGLRGMIVDLDTTNPPEWSSDTRPVMENFTDMVIYELQVRDLSMDPNSGIQQKGKFLGVVESGTKSPDGQTTGLDHIKELGVTHVHLLPTYDFDSVDESKPELNQYNWGYDPVNYNAPEGSYATDPYRGEVRITEFKQMVKALHENGLRVILDVVYNHTSSLQSNFNQFAPMYYYRQNEVGGYSNGSGCGNETASERVMMRKFMVDSVRYWSTEYHIDGFRFDLMGIHDIDTMNEISEAVHAIDPTIFLYGEGWTGGYSPFPEGLRAVKRNTYRLKKIAAFSDDIRDALHGPFGDLGARGFASGSEIWKESVKFGIVASVQHPQVDYSGVHYSKEPWAAEPAQTISYVSSHDNHTLFDRLTIANPEASEAEIIKMDKLCNAVVLTSQGVPFLHAGAEMLRTKHGVENSYRSPDHINQIDWSRKSRYKAVFNYYKGLVALRKNHPAFRMPSSSMIREHLHFLDTNSETICYQINGNANKDSWKSIFVLINGSRNANLLRMPEGEWTVAVDDVEINDKGIKVINSTEISVPATSLLVLFKP